MYKNLLIFLMLIANLSAQKAQFQVEVIWDEFAGEAEGLIQYYNDNKQEIIRGNEINGSDDGNVIIKKTFSEGAQVFLIKNSEARLFNIWIYNPLADEDMSGEEDFLVLSASRAKVIVTDLVNNQRYVSEIPEDYEGLAFHAGMISDGIYTPVNDMYINMGIVKIKVVNALNGEPLAGADVLFTDPRINREMYTGTTDEEGWILVKFPIGKFRATITKDNFMAAEYDFEINYMKLPFSAYLALAPRIDKLRIVLTWGPQPKDLDAHLRGPDPDGGIFHISYRNMRSIGGKNFLDHDNTKGFGPETMTIYKPARGEYGYAVHNYSDRRYSANNRLSFSGAYVRVYNDYQLIATFIPKKGASGTVWEVFKLDHNFKVITVDKYYNSKNAGGVFNSK